MDNDLQALMQSQEDADKKKAMLRTMGAVGDSLSNGQSVGNFYLGQMNPKMDTASRSAEAQAEGVGDPMARQAKAFEYLKSKRENADATDKDNFKNSLKDDTSPAAMAFKQSLISSGGDPAAIKGAKAFDLYTQGFSPAKMAEIKSKSNIEFNNDMAKLRYGKNADLEKMEKGKKIDLEKTNAEPAKPDQTAAATYGRRMQQAEQVFSDLTGKGFNRADKTSALGTLLPAAVQSEDLRRQDQAERNFVNAVLRRESGAAISKDEFNSAEKQYFPRPGDTQAVLEEKAANRQQVQSGMHAAAGNKAWNQIPLISPASGQQKQPPQAKPPGVGEVRKGYKFVGGDPSDKSSWEKVIAMNAGQ